MVGFDFKRWVLICALSFFNFKRWVLICCQILLFKKTVEAGKKCKLEIWGLRDLTGGGAPGLGWWG